ncbi:hypothetical protein BJX63DRAFT_389858 [Aspergillus granulosus]|uniref:Secreted protein n=1 Tax=Aspergillus granulosus TaxID=176169 RepID=A0ABR4HJI3_9EURO
MKAWLVPLWLSRTSRTPRPGLQSASHLFCVPPCKGHTHPGSSFESLKFRRRQRHFPTHRITDNSAFCDGRGADVAVAFMVGKV